MDEVSETLQAGGEGFDEETADCFAQIVVDEVGVEELQDVDLSADEPPEELQDDDRRRGGARARGVRPRASRADATAPTRSRP